MWERALAIHSDRKFVQYVCAEIRHGFRIGFNYHWARLKPVHINMMSVIEHGEVVERYIGEEQETQRVLGPFKHSLFPNWVILKADPGKWRLILDLSSPHGNSVNNRIVKELCPLSYVTVDDIL